MNKKQLTYFRAPVEYKDRFIKESSHEYRTDFMRDRDRILYSKAFRRLSGKTQIFLTSFDDHMRTRLTHTLEVSQIAQTIAKELSLDHELTEAISLGHDLGHTPFGHIGERTLNHIMNGCESFSEHLSPDQKGFKHNLQSVRVATELEQNLNPRPGINLTNFTLYGFYAHSKTTWQKYDDQGNKKSCDYCYCLADGSKCNINTIPKKCKSEGNLIVDFYNEKIFRQIRLKGSSQLAWSLEAFIVAISDEIAQRHHDLEDGIEAKVISQDEVIDILTPMKPFFSKSDNKNFNNMKKSNNLMSFSPMMSRFIVNFLVNRLIFSCKNNLNNFAFQHSITKRSDFINIYPSLLEETGKSLIQFSKDFETEHDKLEKYLRNRILNSFEVQRMDGKGRYLIKRLFKAYLTNPQQLPDKTIVSLYKMYNPSEIKDINFAMYKQIPIGKLRNKLNDNRSNFASDEQFESALSRVISDYIAGMTDNYAITEYHKLYG